MQQNEFQHIPATFWVYALLPFAVIAITLVGIKTHNPFLFGFIGVVPFVFLLVNRIDLWLVTIFAIYNSSLRIPGVLGQLELVHVMIAGLAGVVFLRYIILKKGASRKAWMWRFVYLFAAILLLTVAVRGAGFRFLGDNKWGGMRYVEVFLTLSFMFIVTLLRLNREQWRAAIVAMALMALIPVVADLAFVVTNGAMYHQYYLIKHGAVQDAYQTFGTGEMTRFRSAASGGAAILFLPFILFPFTPRNYWKYAVLVLVGLAFSSLSGHRLGVLNNVAFIWLYLFFALRKHRGVLLAVTVGGGVIGLLLLILLMPHLPLSMQRAFSFVPFTDIDPGVAFSVRGSNEWRLHVWRNALEEVPQYWLLGKGYTFDPQLLASPTIITSAASWARVNVAYHNGILSLLIGMGIFGLIAGIGFLFAAVGRHYRLSRSDWADPVLQRFHLAFMVLLLVRVIIYVTLYGDMHQSFPTIFKLVAILEGLALANRLQTRESAADKEKEPAFLPPPRVAHVSPI